LLAATGGPWRAGASSSVAFAGVAASAHPLTVAVSEAHVEEAPVDTLAANISAPSMINIIFELALVNKVMTLSSDTLHSSVLVHLSEGALRVILADSQVVVHRALVWCVPHDILCVEDAKLPPLLNAVAERLAIVQRRNQSRVVLRL